MSRALLAGFVLGLGVWLSPFDALAEIPVAASGVQPADESLFPQALVAHNAQRARPQTCGPHGFAAAPPLRWNAKLAAAAQYHADDMARRGFFAHQSPEGNTVSDRVDAQGYQWRSVGENIATALNRDVDALIERWMASPDHCANIMDADYVGIGIGMARRESEDDWVWVAVFAAPQ